MIALTITIPDQVGWFLAGVLFVFLASFVFTLIQQWRVRPRKRS